MGKPRGPSHKIVKQEKLNNTANTTTMASLSSNEEQSIARVGPVAESAIEAASALNDLAYGICGSVCFLGDCDKQIQFEVNEETVADYNVINLFQRMANDASAVEASRSNLFDEDSVVSGADSRC